MTDFIINLECMIERNPEIPTTNIDGEIGMMSVEKGKYYGMDEIGSRIWEMLDKPMKLEWIIDGLMLEYEVDRETCEEDVKELIFKLQNEGLIFVK